MFDATVLESWGSLSAIRTTKSKEISGSHVEISGENIMYPPKENPRAEIPRSSNDPRYDAIVRQLENTDWHPEIEKSIRDFSQRISDLSPLLLRANTNDFVDLQKNLSQMNMFITENSERQVVRHLQNFIINCQDEKERQHEDLARDQIGSAIRSSRVIENRARRSAFELVCSLLEDELHRSQYHR